MLTPQIAYPKLSDFLHLGQPVYLKREDLHLYRSHKGRSIPDMLEDHLKNAQVNFVISSSGNAAIAAALHTIKLQKTYPLINLQILVGQNIDTHKLQILNQIIANHPFISLKQVPNPKQTAFQIDKTGAAKNLRQSTDDTALPGYTSLAKELATIPNLSAIFIPTSSGTTALGLFQAFEQLNIHPQIHIVQTTSCHPIAQYFDHSSYPTETSLATAISDPVAHRKPNLINAIQESRGSGWIITNAEIVAAQKITKEKCGLDISPNSALSIAGLQKAVKNIWQPNGSIVCLITGQ